LRVDKFVTELGEEQLRVLLADIVEIFANFGVKADSDVVVNGKLTVLFSDHCQSPSVQLFLLSHSEVLLQQLRSVDFLD
jgi:hypothetical protein